MENDSANKGFSTHAEALPETAPFGTGPTAVSGEDGRPRIAETVDLVHAILAARHEVELRTNPRKFRESLFAELRRRIPVSRGRRPAKHLDQAMEMRRAGMSYHRIAVLIKPEYENWGTYQRKEFRELLRIGLRTRKRRAAHLASETKSPADVPSPTR